MKRRDFIKLSSSAGVAGVVSSHIDTAANPLYAQQASGFDLHPFIKAHPEAVFICLTDIKEKTDQEDIANAAHKLAREMFVSTSGGAGFPNSTKIAGKPNWTGGGNTDPNDPTYNWGIITDFGFTGGFLNGVRTIGPQNVYLRDCAYRVSPQRVGENRRGELAEKYNFNLKDLSSGDFWELGDEIIFKKVDGVIFKEIGFMTPMNAPDSFLINIAKFKSHSMGITATVKNLQGTTGRRFHNFCDAADAFRSYPSEYHPYFQPDHSARIAELHKKHVEAGIPRWHSTMDGSPVRYAGPNMEKWVQRMLDAYSTFPIGTNDIHIVEGIYGRDGDGFVSGPWEIAGRTGRAKDYMSNNVIFGRDPFRVDIITHWIAGHEPGNFGLFHIGIERGFSNVLDPFDIPVYLWENGEAKKVNLDTFKRTPLVTPYLRIGDEPRYHMCDEPFDYKAWKATGKNVRIEPSIRALGTDSKNNIVMEMTVPEKGDIFVDIMNSYGDQIGRLYADDLEPGVHQVVWDGFASPGLYTTYVKGMGWDAENEIVIYT